MTKEEILTLLNGEPPSTIFNPRSASVRKNSIDLESLTEDQMLDLLVDEPRYWKRPVAVIDGHIIARANARTLAEELGFWL